MIRAYLINPYKRQITEVPYDGDLVTAYKLLDCDIVEAAVVDPTQEGEPDIVYVDEEGLLKGPQFFFKLAGNEQPLAGKGLVVGSDSEGNDCDARLPIERIRQLVTWMVVIG
jgi:hypothetical protein